MSQRSRVARARWGSSPSPGTAGTGGNASPYPYAREAAAVAAVLTSGQYGHTHVVEEFERSVARFLGAADAVAVASGTTAPHLALLAAGIGPGHDVVVPSMTAAEPAAERADATGYTKAGAGVRGQMPAMNAAIGSVQLQHFPVAESTRQRLRRTYRDALADVDGVTLVDVAVDQAVPSLVVVRLADRDQVFHRMREEGIAVGVHYPPNHLRPAFANCTAVFPPPSRSFGRSSRCHSTSI